MSGVYNGLRVVIADTATAKCRCLLGHVTLWLLPQSVILVLYLKRCVPVKHLVDIQRWLLLACGKIRAWKLVMTWKYFT